MADHEESKIEAMVEEIAEKLHGHDESKPESIMDTIAEKLHFHDSSSLSSSSSDSDSDDEMSSSTSSLKSKIFRLFGRETPLHKVLGGGKPADVLLWRVKKESAAVLGGATAIWVLFELLEYHLITLVCHGIILALAISFLWSNASTFINKSRPKIPKVHIPEGPVMQFAVILRNEIIRAIATVKDIALGNDLKKFLSAIAGLWVLSIIGSCFNFLTLLYLVLLSIMTAPVLYEKYEDEVDSFAEKALVEIKKQYAVFEVKVLSKIPIGSLKNKMA